MNRSAPWRSRPLGASAPEKQTSIALLQANRSGDRLLASIRTKAHLYFSEQAIVNKQRMRIVLLRFPILLVILSCTSLDALAQSRASGTTTISALARIVCPTSIKVVRYSELNGWFHIEMHGSGTKTSKHDAIFIVRGESDFVVAISVSSRTTASNTGAKLGNIEIEDIHAELPPGGAHLQSHKSSSDTPESITTGGGGELMFTVGGEVPIQSDSPAGLYSGTFAVTINYN